MLLLTVCCTVYYRMEGQHTIVNLFFKRSITDQYKCRKICQETLLCYVEFGWSISVGEVFLDHHFHIQSFIHMRWTVNIKETMRIIKIQHFFHFPFNIFVQLNKTEGIVIKICIYLKVNINWCTKERRNNYPKRTHFKIYLIIVYGIWVCHAFGKGKCYQEWLVVIVYDEVTKTFVTYFSVRASVIPSL